MQIYFENIRVITWEYVHSHKTQHTQDANEACHGVTNLEKKQVISICVSVFFRII